MESRESRSRIFDESAASGVVRMMVIEPSFAFFNMTSRSSCDCSPLITPAAMPFLPRLRFWSAMRKRRGMTTSVMPFNMSEGNWKQSDFPPPVGRMTIWFTSSRMFAIAHRW
jgi:hypothetical protein